MTYEDVRRMVEDDVNALIDEDAFGDKLLRLHNQGGLFAIVVNNVYVYIGKSKNLLNCLYEQKYMIECADELEGTISTKYKMLRKIASWDWTSICIKPVLQQEEYNSDILEQLKAVYIRKYLPYFNVIVPKLDGSYDYRKEFSTNGYDFLMWIRSKWGEK